MIRSSSALALVFCVVAIIETNWRLLSCLDAMGYRGVEASI